VLAAFAVAYLAAGLAEELAKYFGVARYYPTWLLEHREGGVSQESSKQEQTPPGSIPARSFTRRRVGCESPAAGWFAPVANPRVAVYLAFVVGLGFSFTENIQYGANVYEAATAWAEQGNVTMQRNVTLNPFPGALAFAAEHDERRERGEKRDAAGETWSTILAVDASVGDLRAEKGRPYARAAAALDAAVAEEKRIADWTAVPEAGAAEATATRDAERANENPPALGAEAVRDVLEVVSAAFLNWAGADERVMQDDVDAALEAALEETRMEAAARVGEREEEEAEAEGEAEGDASSRLGESPRGDSPPSPKGKKVLVEERGGIGVVDIFGADVPEDVVREIDDAGHEVADLPDDWPNWEGQNVTVNITVRRRPYTEEAKWGAATTVTLLRGATPMHAVWAGLTSTRYVRRLWVERAPSSNALGAIAWSWFYHGTFDFAIMAAPALVASGADATYVFVVLGTGFATMIWSWTHLVKATFALERDLTRAGFRAPNGGRGVPRLGVCTGSRRRTCCCACAPCVGALCPGMGEWDDADLGEADEERRGGGVRRDAVTFVGRRVYGAYRHMHTMVVYAARSLARREAHRRSTNSASCFCVKPTCSRLGAPSAWSSNARRGNCDIRRYVPGARCSAETRKLKTLCSGCDLANRRRTRLPSGSFTAMSTTPSSPAAGSSGSASFAAATKASRAAAARAASAASAAAFSAASASAARAAASAAARAASFSRSWRSDSSYAQSVSLRIRRASATSAEGAAPRP